VGDIYGRGLAARADRGRRRFYSRYQMTPAELAAARKNEQQPNTLMEQQPQIPDLNNWSELQQIEDAKRMDFLRKLHGTPFMLKLPEFEFHFVQDFVLSPRGFTNAQRAAVDEMITQYGDRL